MNHPPELRCDAKTFGIAFGRSTLLYLCGSVLPLVVMVGCLLIGSKSLPHHLLALAMTSDGSFTPSFVLGVTSVSFVTGFGLQLWYLSNTLREQGQSWREIVGLDASRVRAGWKQWLLLALIGLVLSLALELLLRALPIPQPNQAAAALASQLKGGEWILFFLLAAVAAPFFEESIFRGYLFNALTTIFKSSKSKKFALLVRGRADVWAAIVSSAMFSAAHLEPSAFLHLFLFGLLLCAVYRRSGTLVTSIMLHAFNNAIALLVMLFTH